MEHRFPLGQRYIASCRYGGRAVSKCGDSAERGEANGKRTRDKAK